MAIVGSRCLCISDLGSCLPPETTEIISEGATGIDTCAKTYALTHGISYSKFLPDYNKVGKAPPLKRNIEIISCSDFVLAFWNGKNRSTKFVIDYCQKSNKRLSILTLPPN